MKNQAILVLVGLSLFLSGCLKEMKEKEITISVKEEDPIKVLQNLTVDTHKTEVMILGTPHFNSRQRSIENKLFDSLLIALKKFSPNQIGIQTLSPNSILYFSKTKDELDKIANNNVYKEADMGFLAQKKLKTNFKTASIISDSLLKQIYNIPKDEITPYRTKLILNLIASFRLYSAALQWSYIPESIRETIKEMPKPIVDELNRILAPSDEVNTIAITLAKNLGLQKLVPVDDQQDKDIYNKILPDLTKQVLDDTLYNRAANSEVYRITDEIFQKGFENKNLLPYFLYINSQEYAIKDAEAQWSIFYKLNLKSGLDRTRAALWEVRNLNIASNIRRATSLNPESKLLVIVDPSHKPFLEAYLSSLGDIKIVQLNSVLQK
ncbi:MAG: DUF5694 domain-containing protein [Ignavibacteriaceae bacterium]